MNNYRGSYPQKKKKKKEPSVTVTHNVNVSKHTRLRGTVTVVATGPQIFSTHKRERVKGIKKNKAPQVRQRGKGGFL